VEWVGLRAPGLCVTGPLCLLPPPRPRPGDFDPGRPVIADEAPRENSVDTAPRRIIGRPFPRGTTGNPRGRPKIPADVRAVAKAQSHAALLALADVLRRGNPAAARVSAATAILDRAWGKPMQPLEHTGPDGERLFPPAVDLDDEHLDRLVALARDLRTAASGNGHPAP
jgi:hypothetical protein